mgnify:CR=1 FL=1
MKAKIPNGDELIAQAYTQSTLTMVIRVLMESFDFTKEDVDKFVETRTSAHWQEELKKFLDERLGE